MIFPKALRYFQSFGGAFRFLGPRPGRSVVELLPPQPMWISVEKWIQQNQQDEGFGRSAQLIVLFGQHNITTLSQVS